MIEFTPPFFIAGEAGKTLDATARTLEALGITAATLNLAALDVSTLSFTIPAFMVAFLPDQEQEITLTDSATPTPRVLFKGRVTRTFDFKTQVFSFKAEDAWKRLGNAPVKGESNTRPYRVYPTQSLQTTLDSLISLAETDALGVQPPASWPTLYSVPKMALRSMTYGDAIATVLKYCPDAVTVMDYSANPPRLNVVRRTAAQVIDTTTAAHGVSDAKLTPQPWMRALGVTIHYVQRTSYTEYTLASQTAGNVEAEADRQISLMLSGYERTDTATTESLNAALVAYNEALAALNQTAANIDQTANTAALALNWDGIKGLDAGLVAAGNTTFSMQLVSNTSFSFHTWYWKSPFDTDPWTPDRTITTVPVVLRTAAGVHVTSGWYPIKAGAFTDAQLTQAGAAKQTLYVEGELFGSSVGLDNLNSGLDHLRANQGAKVRLFTGYTSWQMGSTVSGAPNYPGTTNSSAYTRFYFYSIRIPVTAINKRPSQVAAILKDAVLGEIGELADHANFVEAPAGLAENYFQAQNWIPMTGSITFSPAAPWKPAPGDYVQFTGPKADPLWAEALAPIAAVEIDLRTGELRATAGFPPRKTLSSLMDALKVPPEDNWQ